MTKLPTELFQKTVWDHDKNPIWLGSSLHLYRNIAIYKFPPKMSSAELSGSLKMVFEALPFYTHFQANDLTPLDKELLFEHFLCSKSFEDTSAGQGFALDPHGKYLLILNEKDHLQLHTAFSDTDLIQAWTHLSSLEESIGKNHPLAFSPRFGYLTSNPLLSGTGLDARAFLHLPALRHSGVLGNILRDFGDEQLKTESLEGTMNDLVGDFLILKNQFTLGVSEEPTLSLLQSTAQKFAAAEQKARSALKSKPSADIKDFVGRSFGLIMHSYQLHPKEALDGLSGLKLGTDLGWVTGTTSQKLCTLMIQLRRGHLMHHLNLPTISPQELSHKRAEWLHTELQGIKIE